MLSRSMVRIRVAALVACMLSASVTARAQSETATLTGVTIDETGAAVADVRVTVTHDATALRRQGTTGPQGTFTLPMLPPGRYSLLAEREGFSAHEMPGIVLNAGDEITVRVQLKVESFAEAVVVTAQKRGEERLQDVPIPVSVVNAANLAASGQSRLVDYYSSIPGLAIVPGPGTGQKVGLTMRGIPPLGDVPTVGIVIDDLPFGSPAVFSAGQQPVPDLDPGDLARVEVLRGPQGTLYGASGMGGLLKFVTTEPTTERFSGRVQVGTNGIYNGSEPGYALRASFNVPVTHNFAIRASGFTRQDPGYIDNPVLGRNGINEARVSGGRMSALWKISDSASFKVSGLYEDTDRNGLNDALIQPGLGELEQSYVPGVGFLEAKTQAYGVTFKADVGKINVTSLTGYNIYTQSDSVDSTTLYTTATEATYGTSASALFVDRETKKFVQEVRFAVPFGKVIDVLAGAFYTHEDTDFSVLTNALDASTGQLVGVFSDRQAPNTYNEYAGFANFTYRFSDRFDVQLGARKSQIRLTVAESYEGPFVPLFLGTTSPFIRGKQEASSDSFTYLATPRFKASDDLMLYARFASGYRPGNVNLGVSPAAIAAGVPPQFDPDKTHNYELGIKGGFLNQRLTIDASVYYTTWSDIQLRVNTALSTVAYTINGGDAKSQGAELTIQVQPLEGTTIAGWMTLNNSALTNAFPDGSPVYGVAGDRLPTAARRSGFVSARRDFPLWGGTKGVLGGQASFVGDRLGQFRGLSGGSPLPRMRYPSYTQIDLRAGVDNTSWSVNVYVNNLRDVRAIIGGGSANDGFPANAVTYIPPRAVGLSLTRTF